MVAEGLPGTVVEHWVRCGKLACRCNRGKRHGPYHVRMWREAGRLRKAYIPRGQVRAVREDCERWRSLRRNLGWGRSQWRRMALEVEDALHRIEAR